MPSVLSVLTESLASYAERKYSGTSSAASAFRIAAAALDAAAASAATTDAQWTAALDGWRAALTTLTQTAIPGAPPLQLLLEGIAYRLPPVPGIDQALAPIAASLPLTELQRWRDDLSAVASVGPISLGVRIPTAQVRRNGQIAADVIGLLPPSGLQIGVDAGVVRGGGSLSFSDQPHWRLSGSFGLSLGPVAISAFGILERPGGSLSLVLLLAARFTPGIQLGFGFQISGVGGLIGVNRRADTDALRARLASGEATDALFADDPASNAPAILQTLGALFVAANGSFVVGPTLQLTWLKIGPVNFLKLDIGVFIELPGPARIVVVGRAVAEVPGPGMPLLHLQLDVVGEVDFVKSLVQIRAALVNSNALGIFRLAGDAVMIVCWGSPPYQVLSIGGFYPGFNPAPAVIAPMRRVSMSVDFDALPGLGMRFEAYVAATTNTFQIGGRLELAISIGLAAEGYVAVDALFQYSPFHFEIDVAGELRVGVFGRTFAGVDVSGHLTGPGPVVLRAAISIDLWLDDFTWSDTFTIGRSAPLDDALLNPFDVLARELVPSNVRARDGADPLVAVSPGPSGGIHLVSPVGTLVFSQHVTPLNIRLERFAGLRLATPTTVRVAPADPGVSAGAVEPAYFAPGTYLDLTTAEALNQQPYDRLDSGFELVFGPVSAVGVDKPVVYIDYYRGRPPNFTGLLIHFDAGVLGLMGARRAEPSVANREPLVAARDEKWVAHTSAGGTVAAASRTAAHVAVRAGDATMALPASDTPISLAGVA